MNKYAPCLNCEDKHEKCHADCERYAEQVRRNQEMRKAKSVHVADIFRRTHVHECKMRIERYKRRGRK